MEAALQLRRFAHSANDVASTTRSPRARWHAGRLAVTAGASQPAMVGVRPSCVRCPCDSALCRFSGHILIVVSSETVAAIPALAAIPGRG
jgi:hypothetical protein